MPRSLIISGRDLRDALIGLVPNAAALLVSSWVLAGLEIAHWWWAFAVAAVTAAVDATARPALRLVAGLAGAFTALFLGLTAQVALIMLALLVVPGVVVTGVEAVAQTLLMVGLLAAVTRSVVSVNDSSYVVGDLIRRGEARRRRSGAEVPREIPCGVVIVQIDGLPYPLLQNGIVSGVLPTLSHWVRSGSHEMTPWWARVPSTTPASQAALLHGGNDGIPAFRWYEKDTGRLMVANRPGDAAEIESRLSDGRGLLADGGVSVSNMFSGDAPTSLMVMSRAARRGDLGPGSAYIRFFFSPFVAARTLVRTVAEIVKELYQGRQQRVRGIEPRIPRRGAYVALRGITNVVLRDLNVALVAEHMMAAAPVIFVDFVDYDEIAHHAGVSRPESIDALAGLDLTLRTLERVAAAAPRDYRFVVLSDHGQSQGTTFRQLTGRTLEAAVREHAGTAPGQTVAETGDVEGWGPFNALLRDVLTTGRPPRTRWARRRVERAGDSGMLAGPTSAATPSADEGERPELVVVGSGNLGLVWFPRRPGRVGAETLTEDLPGLIPGLLTEPGIGFVVVDSARGPLVMGRAGIRVLLEDLVEGRDPLAGFGPRAAADLIRVAQMRNAPDLYVHSTLHARTGEVHAFEELVGSHGGLGGWQNQAVLVHPAGWPVDPDLLDRTVEGEELLYGADMVHRQLVRWLERCGARRADAAAPGS
ncbi:alkaline phosphatase family protein [Kineosporia sp. J2-2]|uniref:Alkaline phosphatase family protein n=1 Tax=Kineosporia corallincola TaxID=2835133 RepID=A0ABS5TPQ5_9ACTN|nr:alkaline phosphatase family protein [Kineosporia corallincola]MBT0772033.1 alkaline phosphatase family protein [Kineosporia corallincola]